MKEWIKFEEDIREGKIAKELGYLHYSGKVPVLITAPHSVKQVRNGVSKWAEERTASLTQYISENIGCHGLIKTSCREDDANFDTKNYFKDKIHEIIENESIVLLLDIHLMSNKRNYNADLGTALGRNIQGNTKVVHILESHLDSVLETAEVDRIFKAINENTIAATMSRTHGIPCVQVEINYKILEEKEMFIRITQAISKGILEILKELDYERVFHI